MIEFENVNFEELKHMNLEEAKEIVKQFDEVTLLEDVGCEFNGERYGTEDLLESDWDDGGKYQYKEEYGLLCKVDGEGVVIDKYDICIVNDITRSGSYFSWDDGGKYQYKEEYGLLCKVDGEGVVIDKYDICIVNDITRSGSYFSEYNYENEFRAEQIVKKVIPEIVIPEHTVITIGE